MSYFKKFTDFLGGIACFIASVFLISRYMEFTPLKPEELEEGVEVKSKLWQFLLADGGKEYRQYIILIFLLIFSIVVSRVLKKYPAVSLCVSVLPLLQTMNMIHRELIYEYAGLFVLLCAVHAAGAFYDAVYFDRTDNKKRTFIGVSFWGAISSAACFGAIKLCEFTEEFYKRFMASDLSEEDMQLAEGLKVVGVDVLSQLADDEIKVITTIMAILIVSVVVAVILRGVYFIDVILAAIPFVYSIYSWHAGKLVCAPMLILVPVAVYFFARVGLFITGVGVRVREV
ncbi:MAG: hypothetical protein J6Q67_02235 [Clostridia bacterium]|nr:hypothetical protein [Clostridia bacterium]